jgi:hypothetical protein
MSAMRLIYGNEKGMVLPLGLMFLAIIAILGTTAVIVTTTDLKIGSNYRASVQAFYVAEAGINEAMHRLNLPNLEPSDPNYNPNCANKFKDDPDWDLSDDGLDDDLDNNEDDNIDETGETYPEVATLQTIDGTELNYLIKIYYKIEDSQFNNGVVDNEVVLYGQDFGYVSGAPAIGTRPVNIIESIGRSGTSQHKIYVEATKELFVVNSKAAIAVNNPPTFTGNSTVLGFNFKKETEPGFKDNKETILGIGDRIGDPTLTKDHYGDTATVEDNGTGDSTVEVPYVYDDLGNWMLEDSGHLPGATSTGDDIDPAGSNGIFGGNGTKAWKEEGIASWSPIQDVLFDPAIYPDAAERLSMLNDLLAKADITDADLETNRHLKNKAPIGIIYITGDLVLGSDTPTPASGYGEGLMYVKGDLDVSATFKFKGLIFVEENVRFAGTFWNLGVILVKGTTVHMSGSTTTLYSKGVLDDLEDYTKSVKILSWKDVF